MNDDVTMNKDFKIINGILSDILYGTLEVNKEITRKQKISRDKSKQ